MAGPYGQTVYWGGIDIANRTGYYVYKDGSQVADVAAAPYTFHGVARGTAFTIGVRAHDGVGGQSSFYSIPYSAPGAQSADVYPLKISANGRYLVNQQNQPVLLTGDSPQGLIVNTGNDSGNPTTDCNTYLSARVAQGFNFLWFNVLANDYTGGRGKDGTQGALTAGYGSTQDGILPFNSTLGGGQYDLSTPNETYFQRVDLVVQLATQAGFILLLDPIETGGWLVTMRNNGSGTSSNNYHYGQFLANRYAAYKNIMWLSGNDYNWAALDDPYVMAVADGIRSVDTDGLQTVEFNELGTPVSSFTYSAWRSRFDIDGTYTYPTSGSIAHTYVECLTDYNRGDFVPVFLMEAFYQNEHSLTAMQFRAQAYWMMTSGACGQVSGEHYSSFLLSGWAGHLSDSGPAQMVNLVNLFSSVAWWNLVPDQSHSIFTAGYGTYDTDGYTTGAATADGTLAIAYVPSGGPITVALGGFAGTVTATWIDPTNGNPTSAGSYAASGTHSFSRPGNNAGGDTDWVLLLQA